MAYFVPTNATFYLTYRFKEAQIHDEFGLRYIRRRKVIHFIFVLGIAYHL